IWRGVAPKAARTPNSRVRSVTTYAITPKMPSAASSNAPLANPESTVTVRPLRTCDRNVRVDGADHAWQHRQQSVRIARRADHDVHVSPRIHCVRDVDLGGGLVLQASVPHIAHNADDLDREA